MSENPPFEPSFLYETVGSNHHLAVIGRLNLSGDVVVDLIPADNAGHISTRRVDLKYCITRPERNRNELNCTGCSKYQACKISQELKDN
jgi:hypothetical protein